MMDVDLRHHFFAIQTAEPEMKARGQGSMINMSSISSMIQGTGLRSYTLQRPAL
jgi:NAD(P)-dependent dehydrogenase (short-subunit alcohol dehydrogenase family)